MRIILITGMSGSGESIAPNVLEDAGYYYADNLPAQLILELACYLADQGYTHLGMATDIHSRESLCKMPEAVAMLREEHDVRVLFSTTSTTALVQRYSETRHRRPLSIRDGHPDTVANVQAAAEGLDTSLIEAIEAECELLNPLIDPTHRIDTSTLCTGALRTYIKKFISDEPHDITLMFESFGFKHDMPTDAGPVLDVRSLPNLYYDTQLRPLTGRGQPVIDFLQSQLMMLAMAGDIRTRVEKWLPSFIANSRGYLTVATGYTGGQHRSVYIVERLATYFHAHDNVLARYRELAVDG